MCACPTIPYSLGESAVSRGEPWTEGGLSWGWRPGGADVPAIDTAQRIHPCTPAGTGTRVSDIRVSFGYRLLPINEAMASFQTHHARIENRGGRWITLTTLICEGAILRWMASRMVGWSVEVSGSYLYVVPFLSMVAERGAGTSLDTARSVGSGDDKRSEHDRQVGLIAPRVRWNTGLAGRSLLRGKVSAGAFVPPPGHQQRCNGRPA